MLFDCMALLIGLVASYIAQLKRVDNEYTFGYSKVETLSGLFNGIFLIFISYNIFMESIERLFEPIHVHDEGLLEVAVIGLVVNLIGIYFFHDFKQGDHQCSHDHGTGHHHNHEERD